VDVEVVRELLNHGANVNTADKDCVTPLSVASQNGHVEVVRELLNHGANVNTADNDGVTPLLVESQNGHVEVMRELVNHGANVNTAVWLRSVILFSIICLVITATVCYIALYLLLM
jgi:ankyrin repeat protein